MPSTDPAVNGGPGSVAQRPAAPESVPPEMLEDLESLVDVAFAEQFGGWERIAERAADGGQQWAEKQNDGSLGPPTAIEKMPPIKGTEFALMEWLDQLVSMLNHGVSDDEIVVWSMQRTARQGLEGEPMFVCAIHVAKRERQMMAPTTIGKGASNDAGFAIAIAMLAAQGVRERELAIMHRDLYAYRYLVG